jgi:hypothetical protein
MHEFREKQFQQDLKCNVIRKRRDAHPENFILRKTQLDPTKLHIFPTSEAIFKCMGLEKLSVCFPVLAAFESVMKIQQ